MNKGLELDKTFLKRGQLPILIVNIILILFFGFLSLKKKNYEFVAYIGVIILFFILILLTNKKSPLKTSRLWGLTFWAFLHMAGGFLYFNGTRLYEIILIKIIETPNYTILRYDMFVHAVGFFVVTLIAYDLINKYLNEKTNWKVVYVLLVLIGLGAGALNEIVELFTVLIVPQTGVGGYYNTAFDLLFDLIGSILAVVWISMRRRYY